MKKVIGIVSIVLFFLVSFQSCAAGLGNAMQGSKEASGSAGIMLAVCMLIGGIITLVSKYSKGVTMTAIVFYVLGGLIGIGNVGSFKDLQIWAVLNLIFAGLLIFNIIKNKELYTKRKGGNANG